MVVISNNNTSENMKRFAIVFSWNPYRRWLLGRCCLVTLSIYLLFVLFSSGTNYRPTFDVKVGTVYRRSDAPRKDVSSGVKTATLLAERAAPHLFDGSGTQGLPSSSSFANGDSFDERLEENPYKRTSEEPVSTFSVDVDTSSYSYVRRLLNGGILPSPHVVQIEEMINYFDYAYPVPHDKESPFESTIMVSDSPWHTGRKLLHIGIQGYMVDPSSRPFSNIVFLVDVSGSMRDPDKLPLAKESIQMLLGTMMPQDFVSIVTYADEPKVVLQPTRASDKTKILDALSSLKAGGATWGTGGIEIAYQVAEQNFEEDAVNRIIILTDGDFNLGLTDVESLKKYIKTKRETGIFLSLLGFGMGNYHDTTMKALANHGNGVAAYIDSLQEANKVLVTESQSTVFPIAKDVKIQIEFNPKAVAEYRLIGYEKRLLTRQDFNNDKVDAGDIGAGHSVTAIYEFTPTGFEGAAALDELRYSDKALEKLVVVNESGVDQEYAFLKIRYKLPDQDTSRLTTKPITPRDHDEERMLSSKSSVFDPTTVIQEFKFATAVAGFAQLLKGGTNTGNLSCSDVLALAEENKGQDQYGYRKEFVQLVRTAKRLVLESKVQY